MKRFFGMMPVSEVKMSRTFVDDLNLKITIDALVKMVGLSYMLIVLLNIRML